MIIQEDWQSKYLTEQVFLTTAMSKTEKESANIHIPKQMLNKLCSQNFFFS